MTEQVHTDSTGTMTLTPTGTGLKLQQGGLSLDGSTPVAGEITGATITSPTLASPTLSGTIAGSPTFADNPSFNGDPRGIVVTKSGLLTENGAGTSYVLTIPIPVGAIIHDIMVIPHVLWNGTSASLKVGDNVDDDGWFVGVDLKATDVLVGEVLSIKESTLWGGQEGAYLVAASGRRGPTATNFGLSYTAGGSIIFTVTPGAADGSAGRTTVCVAYSVGEDIVQVAT